MKKAYKRYVDKVKNHFHEVLRTKTTSESIAMGFAVGTFLSILPLPIIDIFIGLLIVLIFKKINKYSLLGSVIVVWNPVTTAPFYYPASLIGRWIFGRMAYVTYDLTFLEQVYEVTRRLFVGSAIVGAVMGAISYFAVKKGVDIYREKLKV